MQYYSILKNPQRLKYLAGRVTSTLAHLCRDSSVFCRITASLSLAWAVMEGITGWKRGVN